MVEIDPTALSTEYVDSCLTLEVVFPKTIDEREGLAPCLTFLVGCSRLIDVMSNAVHLDPALLRRLLRAKDRIDVASQEAWTIDRLAAISGVSPAHFARSFKAALSVPPHRYLLTRRIERTRALLRDTDLPIIDIAFQTGWASLGAFGRTFRDIIGESPTTVRGVEQGTGKRLDAMPPCFASAAARPNLIVAVSEKRRRAACDRNAPIEGEAT